MMIDVEHLPPKAEPPRVVIEEVRADQVVLPAEGEVRLPLHTRDLTIRYTALSLVLPGRIRFQYLLEGRDTAWHDAEGQRQATYTDLPPGQYRFRVKAANSDGVWSEAGAAMDFTLPAAFYQTRWFTALCALAAAAALYGVYLLRVRQMAKRLRERLAVKSRERERIARDLHDTLLQSTEGLILCFHSAARGLPTGDPARGEIERALDQADQVMAEGRDRVLDLRVAAAALQELPLALAALGNGLAERYGVKFSSTVEGASRAIQTEVRDEAYQIGREALFNAFRHAKARSIELQLIYGERDLRLRVRDDGEGIEAETL
jgi:signal transduction histidine kinase